MSFLLDNAGIISLLFFFCVFVGVAVRTYRPGIKQTLQSYAFIPLEEDSDGR